MTPGVAAQYVGSQGGVMVVDAVPHVGGFHGPQVWGLVGISYRQLDYWARTGLLQPSLATLRQPAPADR